MTSARCTCRAHTQGVYGWEWVGKLWRRLQPGGPDIARKSWQHQSWWSVTQLDICHRRLFRRAGTIRCIDAPLPPYPLPSSMHTQNAGAAVQEISYLQLTYRTAEQWLLRAAPAEPIRKVCTGRKAISADCSSHSNKQRYWFRATRFAQKKCVKKWLFETCVYNISLSPLSLIVCRYYTVCTYI